MANQTVASVARMSTLNAARSICGELETILLAAEGIQGCGGMNIPETRAKAQAKAKLLAAIQQAKDAATYLALVANEVQS